MIHRLGAVELRRLIKRRELSSRELVEQCIARVERANPAINAVVTTGFDAALAAANDADRQTMAGQDLPLLHGLPVLIKDLTETAGMRTTYGSRCFADHIPQSDATIVERLRSAGAIVLGKTNTSEFGAGANTTNLLFGSTGNPYNLELTAGGSSGGSAAALAAQLAPLATGSDLGGSLRIPASFCGVVGMRPSAGTVPSSSRLDGFSPLWTDGPMGRDVADTALTFEAMVGFDYRDPMSGPCRPRPESSEPASDLSSLRLTFSEDLGLAAVDIEIRRRFADRIERLAPLVRSMEPCDLKLPEADRVFRVLRAEALHGSFAGLVASHGDELGPNIRTNVAEAAKLSLADGAEARVQQTTIYRRFQNLFESADAVLCPATAVSPFPLSQDYPDSVEGRPLQGYFAWYAITWALSLTGNPIVTVPCGLDHNGMPLGLQVVGRRHDDWGTLKIAAAIEAALGDLGIGRPKRPDGF